MQPTIGNQYHGGITRYADFVISYRWLVLFVSFFAVALVALGAMRLVPTNDYRVFFSGENPHLVAFEQQQKVYTKNDNVLFIITPQDGQVFGRETLAAIEEVTEAAWQFPYALRVDSLTNFQYSHAEEDDLIVEDLIENPLYLSDEEISAAKEVALKDPLIQNRLLNADASVTAVNITFQMPDETLGASSEEILKANPLVVDEMRALKGKIEEKYPVEVRLSGIVMLSNAFFEASMLDMKTLVPLMFVIIIAVMLILLTTLSISRESTWKMFTTLLSSLVVTIFVLFVIMLSIGAGMGIGGWMGIKLTPPSFSAPTIIMTLAVADSIHFLVTLYSGMRKGMNRHEAIRYSLRLNFGPILLTSVTTAIGFMSMNFSDAPPFHDLGNMTAAGVMAAFVLSVSFLPALIAIVPIHVGRSESQLTNWMENVGEFVIRRRRVIFSAAAIVSVAFVAAIPLNQFDDNFVGYFSKKIDFRNDTDYVNEKLTGIYQVQYSLASGEDYGVSAPDFLQNIESFVEWMRAQPEVTHVNTFTDTFKRINKNMHGDDEAYYRLPEDKQLAAQYLLLYELSLPEGLDLNNQMDIGKSSTQIVVTLKDVTSSKIADISERGSDWLKANTGLESYGVGPAVMFAYISETNMKSMLFGTFVAILLISFLIMLALRSLRIGTLSLIPNLLPLAAAFGLWGILIGEVNVAVSMVTGMALGIVVDDSVHFLSKYLRARREDGLDSENAVRYAFSSVGLAIVITSIILICGFAILAMSNFGMNSGMAILTAIAISMALIADFLLLPVLLIAIDGKRDRGEKETSGEGRNKSEKVSLEGEGYA